MQRAYCPRSTSISAAFCSPHLTAVFRPLDWFSLRWHVRIGCSRCDRRILLQALLEIRDDLQCWTSGPGIANAGRRVFFLRVRDQIECLRLTELSGRGPPIALFVIEDEFPVPPLH